MIEVKTESMCEQCGKEESNSFSCFDFNENPKWKHVCNCSIQDEDYHIKIKDYYLRLKTDYPWLEHMIQKNWFEQNDFLDMIKRYETK